MPENITPRQAALWFAHKGYPVLPLHGLNEARECTCGHKECHSPGKHPYAALTPHGAKDASTDSATVKAWFDEAYWLNYGVVTEQLLTIDADVKHGGVQTWTGMHMQPTRALPHTWQVRTGSGGLHVIFDNRAASIRCGALDKGVDVKGVGGYIVGPASKHVSGGTYNWLPQSSPADAPLAAPPEWLLIAIRTRTSCGRPVSAHEWRQIAGTCLSDGERHTSFLKLAGHLIANPLLDPVVVRELMLGWNRGMCDPPLSDKDVLQMIERLCEREIAKDKWL